MKPVIIYTMPRTRSTAALQACMRTGKINEPFSPYELPCFKENLHNLDKAKEIMLTEGNYEDNNLSLQKLQLYATYFNALPENYANELLNYLNVVDTATKFFGFDLVDFLPARKWFKQCDEEQTHDIFVLVRDLREQMFSYLLAPFFGYKKVDEIEPFDIKIDTHAFYFLKTNIDAFLRFFPKNAKLVTYENLPETHFNRSLVKISEQNSMDKLRYIKNLNECEKYINDLQRYFHPLWVERVNSIPWI